MEREELRNKVQAVLNRITTMGAWKHWMFDLRTNDQGLYFQVRFKEHCVRSGRDVMQSCRKWMLSEHMTDSEIVQTVFLAVKTATEHELRESFLFDGQPVFGPHFDLARFAEILERDEMRDARQHVELMTI